jgi:hypothetical protein
LSQKYKLAPHLILAVMAIESNFHPFVQSHARCARLDASDDQISTPSATKLMGARLSAFDPITNMRVGVARLGRFLSKLREGSVEDGLQVSTWAAMRCLKMGVMWPKVAVQRNWIAVAAGQKPVLP